MDKLQTMKVFVRVAEAASFTRAAEGLGLPKATISSAVQELESSLGTRLFHRTTRKVQLTQDGTIFFERCKDLLSDVEDIETMFVQGTTNITGRIRVDMSAGMAKSLVLPRLPEFLKEFPGVQVEVSSTDRKVDLIREGFDCVIRVGTLEDSGLIARHLGNLTLVNVASPEYIKKFGRPKKIEDLDEHQMVHYSPTLGMKPFGFEYFDGEKYVSRAVAGPVTVNNSEAYTAACLAGLGIIQTPLVGMQSYMDEGKLIEVLPKLRAEAMPVSLLYPHRRNLARRVQIFMEWVEKIMKDYIT
ncbi:transcriptional regulator [Bdellovibrio bacteriovorus]|uniref:Transcriptional regulator n=1 Tax=Bdellovibrio bacteriovorus TaxID=959 RepID=A0A150WRM9_BDEBC|nr:LysR family transcriptional regulator [Bdellovibrio bacteriovorus]KYG66984.1 transcriptional regulator [Bdellovibrio bacteriovorus]